MWQFEAAHELELRLEERGGRRQAADTADDDGEEEDGGGLERHASAIYMEQ
jgi:hypothetical protein